MRRRMVKRIAGRLVTLFRVPVRCCWILETLPETRLARVLFVVPFPRAVHTARALSHAGLASLIVREAHTVVETWVPFERLASTRKRFCERLVSLAQVIPPPGAPSGELQLPAKTAPREAQP